MSRFFKAAVLVMGIASSVSATAGSEYLVDCQVTYHKGGKAGKAEPSKETFKVSPDVKQVDGHPASFLNTIIGWSYLDNGSGRDARIKKRGGAAGAYYLFIMGASTAPYATGDCRRRDGADL